MAIVCNTCKYILSETEVLSHVVYDIYDVVKETAPTIVPDVISSCVLSYIQKRGYVEDIALTAANRHKVVCSVCMEYKGWTKIQDNKIE